jgi:hypothetical protein
MARHYARKSKTKLSDFFEDYSEDTRETTTLKHYKSIVLEKILHDSDPNDRHIKEWTAPHIQVKRLLKDMEREGYITITMINDRGCIRRVLTPTGKRINT